MKHLQHLHLNAIASSVEVLKSTLQSSPEVRWLPLEEEFIVPEGKIAVHVCESIRASAHDAGERVDFDGGFYLMLDLPEELK